MNRGLRPLTPPRAGATPDRRAGHPREEVRQGWVNFRSPDGSVFDCRSHTPHRRLARAQDSRPPRPPHGASTPRARPSAARTGVRLVAPRIDRDLLQHALLGCEDGGAAHLQRNPAPFTVPALTPSPTGTPHVAAQRGMRYSAGRDSQPGTAPEPTRSARSSAWNDYPHDAQVYPGRARQAATPLRVLPPVTRTLRSKICMCPGRTPFSSGMPLCPPPLNGARVFTIRPWSHD